MPLLGDGGGGGDYAYDDDFEPPMTSASYAAASSLPSSSSSSTKYVDDDEYVEEDVEEDGAEFDAHPPMALIKKASASELHLKKLRKKQKRRKLKEDLRRALAGVEKAATTARNAADRVLKTKGVE